MGLVVEVVSRGFRGFGYFLLVGLSSLFPDQIFLSMFSLNLFFVGYLHIVDIWLASERIKKETNRATPYLETMHGLLIRRLLLNTSKDRFTAKVPIA